MILTEKETTVIKDLQTQEKSCIEKYARYSKEAHDSVLRDLFMDLSDKEQRHYDTLEQVLTGKCPCCDCNDHQGEEYNPKATYDPNAETKEKQEDCFLATDCIGTEKMVSSEYNSNVFVFGDTKIRKILADLQIEEQNHAECLWKYKTVNGMS